MTAVFGAAALPGLAAGQQVAQGYRHVAGPFPTFAQCDWNRVGREVVGYKTTRCVAPVYQDQWFYTYE